MPSIQCLWKGPCSQCFRFQLLSCYLTSRVGMECTPTCSPKLASGPFSELRMTAYQTRNPRRSPLQAGSFALYHRQLPRVQHRSAGVPGIVGALDHLFRRRSPLSTASSSPFGTIRTLCRERKIGINQPPIQSLRFPRPWRRLPFPFSPSPSLSPFTLVPRNTY